ncbi:ABC transporter substrate-binding protein [Hyalangium gracile]|uniref:ABC transporter substrate-binding protein n=1 Tax=Hyalangium gracile TaxID=394092 RepID=UPI001CCC1EDE|nr:sugar ABC transporter substrate-binding protein [Hyalangium gracile]
MKRTAWTVMWSLALAALLGGCKKEADDSKAAPAAPPSDTRPPDAPSTASAEVTLQLFGDPIEVDAYRQLIATFEARNPDVKVRLIPIGKQKDHMVKLTTGFSGGTPPDLFLLNYRRYAQFAGKGVLEPLGMRLEKSTALKEADLYPATVEAFRYQGTLTCLPQNISSLVVYYNRGLFQRFKVPLPTRDWTWEDFRQAAKALTQDTDGDGRNDIHGLGMEPTLARLAPFLWQAGGDVVDNLQRPTRFLLLTQPSQDALRFVLELQRVHRVTPSLEEAKSEDLEARFMAGRLGMLLQSRRLVPTLRSVQALDWDVAPLPRNRAAATVLHSDAYCMARDSKVKDQAFRFVEFALGPVGAELIAHTGRTVPSLRKVAESPAFLDPSQRPASARVFLDSIPTIRRLPSTPEWNELETRADPIVEEWFYTVPEGGTLLRDPSAPADPEQGPGGSAKHLLRRRDEVTTLGYELDEATVGLLAPSKVRR